jgi:hypothetical protein
MTAMEQALWYDWRVGDRPLPRADRIYYGHETCERLLPSRRRAQAFAASLAQRPGSRLTLVTPFLTDDGLRRVLALIDILLTRLGELEVVCSDWGLVHELSRERTVTLVLGRLLTAQVTDPRIPRLLEQSPSERTPREIRHMDGTRCALKPAFASDSLRQHYRSCWVDKPEAIALLGRYGIGRCELSNAAQGLALAFSGLRYTLHMPEVLVTVMRTCPGRGEDFNRPPAACPCTGDPAAGRPVAWSHATLPVALFRRDNALYYHWPAIPDDLHRLPVDRIVAGSGDCSTAAAILKKGARIEQQKK